MPALFDPTDILKGDPTSVAVFTSEAEEPPDLMGSHGGASSQSWTNCSRDYLSLRMGVHLVLLLNEGTI